ncbi:MAG: ribulose bisphosphate carboxylase small subunit [Alphaproteobacteria bacterium]|jgi:ribulose-bisphosphate carboxylase small chain|nr:ribulose bisphosphate carboxylase small subunit [Alphaproteobacteria bacterium]MBT4710103.1 ribulose bisphosphate carboxylase small subunit [Alphaproteobacteria bacterium]MBT5861259.1 ribulose bisphosphate carboxylase small subunit [Alphaproteobacteria bacterium]
MKLTQGTFSFLPDLTDDEIKAQIQYAMDQGWALNVEYTDDPHPRNTYWELWCQPMFDTTDPAAVMMEVAECRKVYGNMYIKVNSFDNTRGRETVSMSFIVNRPKDEPGFGVSREESHGRNIRYRIHSYATDKPEGRRYE